MDAKGQRSSSMPRSTAGSASAPTTATAGRQRERHWQRRGDCEDYAIAKMQALKEGPGQRPVVTIGRDNASVRHMPCCAARRRAILGDGQPQRPADPLTASFLISIPSSASARWQELASRLCPRHAQIAQNGASGGRLTGPATFVFASLKFPKGRVHQAPSKCCFDGNRTGP
jgi:hypothetical protein